MKSYRLPLRTSRCTDGRPRAGTSIADSTNLATYNPDGDSRYISIAELETLVQAYDGDLSYPDLLNARSSATDEISRARSLHNFLLLNAGWDGKARRDNAEFAEWFEKVAAAKLASWGFTRPDVGPI